MGEEEKELFKFPRKIDFLLELTKWDEKKVFTFSDIEKDLDFNNPQPDIRTALHFLIKEEIVVLHDEVFSIKRYRLKKKKLIDFIDSLEITNKFSDFFHEHHFTIMD